MSADPPDFDLFHFCEDVSTPFPFALCGHGLKRRKIGRIILFDAFANPDRVTCPECLAALVARR